MENEGQKAYDRDKALLFELMRERISLRNQMSPKLSSQRLLELQKQIDKLDENMKFVQKRVAEAWKASQLKTQPAP